MFVMVVAGRMGSGKSRVVHMLAQHGAHTIDLDILARDILFADVSLHTELDVLWGSSWRNTQNQAPDTQAIASKIFNDPNDMDHYLNLVYPRVQKRVERLLSELREQGVRVCVLEVSVLNKALWLLDYSDHCLVVTVPEEIRAERLLTRGVSREEQERRLSYQSDEASLQALADTILYNQGSIGDLEAQVERWWKTHESSWQKTL